MTDRSEYVAELVDWGIEGAGLPPKAIGRIPCLPDVIAYLPKCRSTRRRWWRPPGYVEVDAIDRCSLDLSEGEERAAS